MKLGYSSSTKKATQTDVVPPTGSPSQLLMEGYHLRLRTGKVDVDSVGHTGPTMRHE
jgi:hypothetical protein